MAEERQKKSDGIAPQEARGPEAAPVATLAQIFFLKVEEQLVSKKIAERLPVLLAAKSATLAALERLEKARKELDEASRELLCAEPAGPQASGRNGRFIKQKRANGQICRFGLRMVDFILSRTSSLSTARSSLFESFFKAFRS